MVCSVEFDGDTQFRIKPKARSRSGQKGLILILIKKTPFLSDFVLGLRNVIYFEV